MKDIQKGDYVIGTKYSDGDPQDHWCVGYYKETIQYKYGNRFTVVDNEGNSFPGNGFRRIEKIDPETGRLLVENIKLIESSRRSVWAHLAQIHLLGDSYFTSV